LANEADIIPFPKEELTPPVTKINFDLDIKYYSKISLRFQKYKKK
jgi:hypothetical protein